MAADMRCLIFPKDHNTNCPGIRGIGFIFDKSQDTKHTTAFHSSSQKWYAETFTLCSSNSYVLTSNNPK